MAGGLFSKVRVEVGDRPIFTRMFIDGKELHGIVRLWFDSGDINEKDGPRHSFANSTRIHVEFYPQELVVEGTADVDLIEMRPMVRG